MTRSRYLAFPHKFAWGWTVDVQTGKTYSHTYDSYLGVHIRLPNVNMMVEDAEDAEDLALTMAMAAAAGEKHALG